ncbi:MAG: hypothetical protein ACK5IQ_00400 [Bacteroidales bacterium]
MDAYIIKFAVSSIAFLLSISAFVYFIVKIRTGELSKTDLLFSSFGINPEIFDNMEKHDMEPLDFPSSHDDSECIIIEKF